MSHLGQQGKKKKKYQSVLPSFSPQLNSFEMFFLELFRNFKCSWRDGATENIFHFQFANWPLYTKGQRETKGVDHSILLGGLSWVDARWADRSVLFLSAIFTLHVFVKVKTFFIPILYISKAIIWMPLWRSFKYAAIAAKK